MTKADENIKSAQNMLGKIVERYYELEEENKELKEKIELLYIFLEDREESIELLKKELESYKKQYEHSMWED